MPEKDAKHEMDELIQRSTEMEMPAEVEERLRRRMAEFRAKVEQRPAKREWAWFGMPVALRVMTMTAALLAAVAAGFVVLPRESHASRIFQAAAAQLKNTPSLEYTIELAPYTTVDFSFLAPAYRRINCSWGIEVRTDGSSGRQLVLMHWTRMYLLESGKSVERQAQIDDFAEQLRSLPAKADEVLGERPSGDATLMGYRLHDPPNGSIAGLTAMDLWIDARTGAPHHVDITVQEAGKPEYQMHITNIREGAAIDRALFDLTPPAGYVQVPIPEKVKASASVAVKAVIAFGVPVTAVVVPMQGPYTLARMALQGVESYLKSRNVAITGAPFGRFESEKHWEVGFPVPEGTQVEAPCRLLSLPGTLTASAVVTGAWAENSDARWTAFLASIVEQGYVPAGPPTETWSGVEGQPGSQSTEMTIAVNKAQ